MANPPVQFDRTPPQDEAAEAGLLGCVIANPDVVIDLAVEKGIRKDSFYFPAHQILWETILEMRDKLKAIDPVMISTRLREKNVFEDIGGIPFLQRIVEAAPIAVHAESYLEVVRQKSLMRNIMACAQEAVAKCYDPDRDVDQIINETQTTFLDLNNLDGDQIWRSWPGLIQTVAREINDQADNKRGILGIPSGFSEIDRMLRGLKPAEMIVLAARPSMGKTSLALNIAENIATGVGDPERKPRGVAVFSLEMSAESLVRRMVCCRARVSASKIGAGFLAREQHESLMKAADELKSAPIFIDDSGGLDVADMRARARRLKNKEDIQFIIVDYLQIAHCAKYAKESWQREVGGISGELKAMAKELDVPVMVLSQLSRAAETRDRTGVPKLSDLRDSGSIEQDADVVFLLRRPARYPDDPNYEDKTLAIVDIAKNRNGGVGPIELNFFDDITRFDNRVAAPQDMPTGNESYAL
ncbi:MAG: replicative DNA helicase [Verrucomicrobia bacterium]|nr:replicative DNA helicase [Verrucomicrobiota bacterium]MCH8525701.1 replicative DNA helicase [Kiritimatiellia bacterium]